MIYEVPPMFVYGFYLLLMVAGIAFVYMFQGWRLKRRVWDKKTKSHKMIAGLREADGFVHNYLVPIENAGMTVTIKGGIYFLPKEKLASSGDEAILDEAEGDEGKPKRNPPPPIMFMKYPEGGFGPKVVLRYEVWDEGNPEPVRGFYGKFVKKGEKRWVLCDPTDEGAVFVKNQLMITTSGLASFQVRVEAAAMGDEVREMEAQAETFKKAMANMPSKVILYILLFLAIVSPFIAGMLGY